MSRPILLDTCAVLWLSDDVPIAPAATDALAEAEAARTPIFVSPITAWEVATLVSRGRLALTMDPAPWFQRVLASGLTLSALTPDVLVASAFLPACKLREPADKILTATARANGYRLMTRDRLILEYGASGRVETIAC